MTRIALVLAGELSAGSYVAGAASEVLHAVAANRAEPLELGVVVGASGGSLTAGMVARAVLVNRHLGPWIERTWTEAVDVNALLADEGEAALSGRAFENLASVLIAGGPAADDEPLAEAGELRLGVTRSRIDAADAAVPDAARFRLGPDTDAADPVWEEAAEACLQAVARPPRLCARSAGSGERFADGALSGADPVDLAATLVAEAGGGAWHAFVAAPATSPRTGGGNPSALALLEPLLESGPAAGLAARTLREEGALLPSIAERLPELVERLDDPDALAMGRHIGALAERAAEVQASRIPRPESAADPAIELLDRGLRRIAADPRYAPALGRMRTGAGRKRLAKLLYVVEAVGGGAAPFSLRPIRPPEGDPLRGPGLQGLAELLHPAWREHDFRAGRRDARAALEAELGGILDAPRADDTAYAPSAGPVDWTEVPPHARRRLEAWLEARADRLLRSGGGGLGGLLAPAWRPGARRGLARAAIDELRRHA